MSETNSESWTNESFSHISLRELAVPLFRRKRILVITFLVVFAVVILTGSLAPPEFTSHMAILVKRERLDPLVTTEATTQLVTAGDPVSEEEMNSEEGLLKSRDVLEKVVLANGLQNRHGHSIIGLFRPKQNKADRIERAVQSLAKNIKAGVVTKTNLIEITYSSSDPQLSYEVLKTLGALYMDKRIAVHRPPGSYDFFAQETQNYRQALEASEDRLRRFGEQQGAAAPDLLRTGIASQLTNSIGQMHLSEEAIAADEGRIHSVQQQVHTIPLRTLTLQSTSPADRLLDNLQTTLLAAQNKRIQLALKYDSRFPLVREADQEIAAAKVAIAEAKETRYMTQTTDRDPAFELLREDRAKTEADLAAQRANLAAIRRSIQSLQAQMTDLDQKSLTQQDLLRDIKANETNYLLYLSKREQERTSDALDKTRIANVAIAVPPDIPALPERSISIIFLVALGLATALAIALAYLVEYFDSSFHTPDQVTNILGIPIVVAVPNEAA